MIGASRRKVGTVVFDDCLSLYDVGWIAAAAVTIGEGRPVIGVGIAILFGSLSGLGARLFCR